MGSDAAFARERNLVTRFVMLRGLFGRQGLDGRSNVSLWLKQRDRPAPAHFCGGQDWMINPGPVITALRDTWSAPEFGTEGDPCPRAWSAVSPRDVIREAAEYMKEQAKDR